MVLSSKKTVGSKRDKKAFMGTTKASLLFLLFAHAFSVSVCAQIGDQSESTSTALQIWSDPTHTPQSVRRFRRIIETKYVRQEVIRYRPIQKAVTQTRTYKVAKPITETGYREERYSVRRPVIGVAFQKDATAPVENARVPMQSTSWIAEQLIRKTPALRRKVAIETRVEVVQLQQVQLEAYTEVRLRPVTRSVYVPYDHSILVPKRVIYRLPLQYIDPFSPAIVSGYSSFQGPIRQPSPSTHQNLKLPFSG